MATPAGPGRRRWAIRGGWASDAQGGPNFRATAAAPGADAAIQLQRGGKHWAPVCGANELSAKQLCDRVNVCRVIRQLLAVVHGGMTPIHEVEVATLLSAACSVLIARFHRATLREHDTPSFYIPLLIVVLAALDTMGLTIREMFMRRFTASEASFGVFAFAYQYALGNTAVFGRMNIRVVSM